MKTMQLSDVMLGTIPPDPIQVTCPCCGQWCPDGHPESHGHADDCKYKQIVEHQQILKNALNSHAPDALVKCLVALHSCINVINIALNAEGDTFGVHHNTANDAVSAAESAMEFARNVPIPPK